MLETLWRGLCVAEEDSSEQGCVAALKAGKISSVCLRKVFRNLEKWRRSAGLRGPAFLGAPLSPRRDTFHETTCR